MTPELVSRLHLPKILLISIVSSLTAGCAALLIGAGAAAGAGSVAYYRGQLKAIEKATIPQAYQATLKAIDRLEFFTTKKQKDQTNAIIYGRTTDDKKITIAMKKLSDELVDIRIRVGLWGDEIRSRQILEEIRKSL